MKRLTKTKILWSLVLVGVLFFALIPVIGRSHFAFARSKHDKGKTVYVCACLKTKSCSCMTEAKMEGPCACGTQGGPPMQAVASDSDWAKQNRDALAH